MWSKLEVFYHIVKAGSLVKAAKVLKTDQPSLTHKLKTLENKFGFKLINRSTPQKPLSLTRKGAEVFKTAEATFMLVQKMNTKLYRKDGLEGQVRLNTTHAIGNYILAPHLVSFIKKYPKIDLDLSCNNKELDIFNNEIDVAIRPYIEDTAGLVQEYLFTLQAGLYASPEYLKEFGIPKSVQDLDNHRLLTFTDTTLNSYAHWPLEIGKEKQNPRKPFHTANSVEQLLFTAEGGAGIVSSYEQMVKGRGSNLVRVLDNVSGSEFKIYMIYPESVKDIERITEVRSFFKEAFGN